VILRQPWPRDTLTTSFLQYIKAVLANEEIYHPPHFPHCLLAKVLMFNTAFLTFATAALATLVNAAVEPVFVKQNVNWTEHQFMAPGPDDVRSPCPGLNTYVAFPQPNALLLTQLSRLANHGFLNRTGRNIGIEEILQAGLGAYPSQSLSCCCLANLMPHRRVQRAPRYFGPGSKNWADVQRVIWSDVS